MNKIIKRRSLLLLVLIALVMLCGCSQVKKCVNDKDTVILYTNDVHCGINDNIGYAGLSYLKNQLSQDNYFALVDCGDSIQGDYVGTVSNGEYIIELMNALDYDLAIPGNHEFDYGVDTYLDLTKKANFPYLCCNLTYTADGSLVFDSYKLLEFGSIKVGFVGVLTPETIHSSTPERFYNEEGTYKYDFAAGNEGSDLWALVQNSVDAVKKAGADYVICLSHLGDVDSLAPYRSLDMIKNTTGIDVVLDGHSHSIVECNRVKNADGEYVLLTQTGTKLQNVGMLVISKNGNISTGLISSVDGTDQTMVDKINEIEAEFQEKLNSVVAHSDYTLSIYKGDTTERICRKQETSLGDLIADAAKYYGQTDIGMTNGGGIRATLEAGDVTYGDLYKVQPFGNTICVIEATGQQILDCLEAGARALPSESGGFMLTSGLTYEVDTTIPSSVTYDEQGLFTGVSGEYRVKNVKVNGVDLDLTKTYTICGSNYVLTDGGDGRTMFNGCKVLKNEGYLDVDVLLDYINSKLGGNIGSEYSNNDGDGRITIQ